eukprot:COSAG06_NODE_67791_length_251_cov_0.638158_1_plen_59_part_01
MLELQASFRGKSGEKTAEDAGSYIYIVGCCHKTRAAPAAETLEMPPATRRAVRDATNLL